MKEKIRIITDRVILELLSKRYIELQKMGDNIKNDLTLGLSHNVKLILEIEQLKIFHEKTLLEEKIKNLEQIIKNEGGYLDDQKSKSK